MVYKHDLKSKKRNILLPVVIFIGVILTSLLITGCSSRKESKPAPIVYKTNELYNDIIAKKDVDNKYVEVVVTEPGMINDFNYMGYKTNDNSNIVFKPNHMSKAFNDGDTIKLKVTSVEMSNEFVEVKGDLVK